MTWKGRILFGGFVFLTGIVLFFFGIPYAGFEIGFGASMLVRGIRQYVDKKNSGNNGK